MYKTTLFLIFLLFLLAALIIFVSEKSSGKRDLTVRKRYASAVVLALLSITSIYFGGATFALFILIVSIICIREFLKMMDAWEYVAYRCTCLASVILIALAAYLEPLPSHSRQFDWNIIFFDQLLNKSDFHPFFAVIIPVIMINLLVPIFMRSYQGMVMKEMTAIFATIYFGWFLAHAILLRNLAHGLELTAFLLIVIAANDTCAFAIGKFIGKHKLVPEISPKKTWEGFIGGVLGSISAAMLFQFLLPGYSIGETIVAAVLISLTAPFGDLIVSVIKRDMKLKDSSNFIPGHGGLLDRMDSVIFSTPNFFYFVLLVRALS